MKSKQSSPVVFVQGRERLDTLRFFFFYESKSKFRSFCTVIMLLGCMDESPGQVLNASSALDAVMRNMMSSIDTVCIYSVY